MALNIVSKYKKLSAPVKASFWFLVCSILQKGISMITIPIFTRLLSTAEFGKYSIYYSWAGIISIFVTLNLSAGVFMRGLIKFEDDRDVFTSSIQGLATFSILIFTTIYLLFHNFWDSVFDLSFILMITMFTDMLATTAFELWSSRQRVDFKYKKLVIIILFNSIASPIIGIIAVKNTVNKVEARIIVSLIVDLIAFGFLYINQAKKGKQFYNKKYWKYALYFNLPLIPHYLSQVILNQSDRLMINYLCGSDKAGIYSVAYSLALVMQIVNTSVLNTLNPWIYKKIKKSEFSDIANVSYYTLIIIAFVNLLLIALAPEAIYIMAPKAYHEAIWIITPVADSVFFMFMYSLFADFEFYYEKTKFIMIASMLGAGLNIILNYIFINLFGFIAAGYTTLVCYIFYSLSHYFFMRKINKKYMGGIKVYNSKIILLISLAFLALSACFTLLYNYTVIRIGLIVIALMVALVKRYKIIPLFKQIQVEK